MAKIGIIGWGFVGQATGNGFATNKNNQIFWYDKYKKGPFSLSEVITNSEFIFIAVPTPMYADYSGMDMGIVEEVIDEVAPQVAETNKILIIKSTVLPGTTMKYIKKYPPANFAMNPEFLTQNNANHDFLNPARTVIGAENKALGERIKALYQTILKKDHPYFITDTTTAEMSKYMSNVLLASKSLIANEFYVLSQKVKANYEEVRKIVEGDPRIGTHLRVPGPDGDFGFGGACFPKDLMGILGLAKDLKVDVSALEAIWEKNLKIRKNRDWEKMPSAFGASKKK